MTAEQVELGEDLRPVSWPMVGVHVGLIVIIFGAIYTSQIEMRGMVPTAEWAGYIAVGLALVLVGVIPAADISSAASRGLLALGAAMALYLGSTPWLADLPGGAFLMESPVGQAMPAVAHLGVVIAGVFLGLQAALNRRILPRRVPFRMATVVAVLILLFLGIVAWLALRNIYDLSMTTGPSVLIFRTVAYGLLMVVALTIPGVRTVRRAPHIYLGLALIGAVVRNLVVS